MTKNYYDNEGFTINTTKEAKETLRKGYLKPGETVEYVHKRVALGVSKYFGGNAKIYEDVIYVLKRSWIGLATPVFTNYNTPGNALPISCYAVHLDDSINSIFSHTKEVSSMSKLGGGVGVYLGDVRPSNKPISGGGTTTGVVPVAGIYDRIGNYVSQGSTRRGAFAFYLPITHPDVPQLLESKNHFGDPRTYIDSNIALTVNDEFMNLVLSGDEEAGGLWSKVLATQMKSGSPYLLFSDNVNRQNPSCYKERGLEVSTSNICCLTGDTLVAVADGRNAVKIADLVGQENIKVYSARFTNKKQWKPEIKPAKCVLSGYKEVYRITLSDGSSFKCTDNHPLALLDGTYVDASESLGKTLESFVGYSPQPNARYINTVSNGHAKQSKMIWEESGRKVPKGYHLDHKVNGGGDFLDNLQVLSREEHFNKTSKERMGSSNPIHKVDKDYHSYYVSQTCSGHLNGRFCGIDNYKLIEMGKEALSKKGYFNKKVYKEELITQGAPKTFSKYRFNRDFYKFVDYVYGRDEYNGECEHTNKFVPKKDLAKEQVIDINKGLTVVGVEMLDVQPVYDLEVKDNHNFYIITNQQDKLDSGVLVHNTEITLHTDEDHSFVCCLSSLNLALFHEWQTWKGVSGLSVIELCVYILDAVMEEFIEKASHLPSMGRSLRFAQKSRAIGVGVMGYHYALQLRGLPFKSYEARKFNKEVFGQIKEESDRASRHLAMVFGEPEWCKGSGFRNSHRVAVAPTRSNSVISNAFSAGIEPITSNIFVAKEAKGSFVRKNGLLTQLLEKKGQNTEEVWDNILKNNGSVMGLDFLTYDEKQVFLTAREISQMEIVRQAAERQPFIDQAQSINRFYHPDTPISELNRHVFAAWNNGVKTLYYTKSSSDSAIKAVKDKAVIVSKPDCPYCKKAKHLMDLNNISYIEYDRSSIENFPYKTVPQIHFQGHYVGSYDQFKELLKIQGKRTFGEFEQDKATDCSACEG